MDITVAAIFTERDVVGLAGTDENLILAAAYDRIVSPRLEGAPGEDSVTALAAGGNKPAAARAWFDTIGCDPGMNVRITTAVASLADPENTGELPSEICLGIVQNPDYVYLAPTRDETHMWAMLYLTYVKEQLGKTPSKAREEDLVMEAAKTDFATATRLWFATVAPRAGVHKLFPLAKVTVLGANRP